MVKQDLSLKRPITCLWWALSILHSRYSTIAKSCRSSNAQVCCRIFHGKLLPVSILSCIKASLNKLWPSNVLPVSFCPPPACLALMASVISARNHTVLLTGFPRPDANFGNCSHLAQLVTATHLINVSLHLQGIHI